MKRNAKKRPAHCCAGRFQKTYFQARPGRNYIFLVVSAAIAGAAIVVSVDIVVVVVDSVAAGVVVVVSAVFDSHEARPTARNKADTFSRLLI